MKINLIGKYIQNPYVKPEQKEIKDLNQRNQVKNTSYTLPSFYYPVSFGAKTLDDNLTLFELDKLGRINKKPVKVSVLTRENELDSKKMKKLASEWSGTDLGAYIAETYLEKKYKFINTFVLEENNSNGRNKILSAATVVYSDDVPPSICNVEYLQSSPEILEKKNIKGAGEVLLYSIVKEAQKNKIKSVILYPYEDVFSFYEHIGFHNAQYKGSMGLNADEYGEFLKRIEGKYFSDTESKDNYCRKFERGAILI